MRAAWALLVWWASSGPAAPWGSVGVVVADERPSRAARRRDSPRAPGGGGAAADDDETEAPGGVVVDRATQEAEGVWASSSSSSSFQETQHAALVAEVREMQERVEFLEEQLRATTIPSPDEEQSLLEMFSGAFTDFVMTKLLPRSHPECRFHYAKAVCVPRCACELRYKLGDLTPSRACRAVAKPAESCVADITEEKGALEKLGDAVVDAAEKAWRSTNGFLREAAPSTDAECDWSWADLRCAPSPGCEFRFRFGDYHLGRSCRVGNGSAVPLGAIAGRARARWGSLVVVRDRDDDDILGGTLPMSPSSSSKSSSSSSRAPRVPRGGVDMGIESDRDALFEHNSVSSPGVVPSRRTSSRDDSGMQSSRGAGSASSEPSSSAGSSRARHPNDDDYVDDVDLVPPVAPAFDGDDEDVRSPQHLRGGDRVSDAHRLYSGAAPPPPLPSSDDDEASAAAAAAAPDVESVREGVELPYGASTEALDDAVPSGS